MIPAGVEVYVSLEPVNLRLSFDRLAGLVSERMGRSARSAAVFVFFNRRQHRCKILYWDRDGLVVWAKRLERGRFQIPAAHDDAITVEIDGTMLVMILGGVDLQSVQRRKRYQVPPRPSTTVDSNDANDVVGNLPNCLPATV